MSWTTVVEVLPRKHGRCYSQFINLLHNHYVIDISTNHSDMMRDERSMAKTALGREEETLRIIPLQINTTYVFVCVCLCVFVCV